ncbi:MAG: transposase [Bacteroidales bacterium]
MKKKRRQFSSAFKARVAIEAIKERESLQELSNRFEVHPTMISKWKMEFLEKTKDVFDTKSEKESEVDVEKFHAKIGQLQMENDFLKKSLKKSGL